MTRTIKPEEVADILRVKVERVYELCRQGILPHIRLGRQIRIDEARFNKWLEDGGQALPGGWRREASR